MRHCLLLLLVFLCITPPLLAQQTTGTLGGKLQDLSGDPVIEATIEIEGPSLQGTRSVLTDGQGMFQFPVLPVGLYSARITGPSGTTLTLEGLGVRLGKSTNLGTLVLGADVPVTEVVIVTGRGPVLDSSSQELGSSILDSDFRSLPLDRDFRSIASILPHAGPSYLGDGLNFAGSTGIENRYYIDGVDNTEPSDGAGSTSLPYNFVKAMQVRMGGYQAEFRGALGGHVNAITRTGSNIFSGQAFGFFVNNSLTSQSAQIAGEDVDTDFTQYDLGLSFGGPLVRDKLWYYAAYNPTVETEVVDHGEFGTFDDKTLRHRFATNLNWRPGDNTDVRLSILGDPGKRDQARSDGTFLGTPAGFENIDPLLTENQYRRFSGVLDVKHWLGTSRLLHTSFSGFRSKKTSSPSTARGLDEALFIDRDTGIWFGGTLFKDTDDVDDIKTLRVDGTWFTDRHDLKAGVDYMWKSHESRSTAGWIEGATDPETDIYTYRRQTWDSRGQVKLRLPGVFLQDSWRLESHWNLNLGVRWDGQSIIDSNGDTAQQINDQWQPRLGLSYQWDDSTPQQVFASAGRFYQDLNLLNLPAHYSDQGFYRVVLYDSDPRVGSPDSTIAVDIPGHIAEEIDGLKGQHFDEVTLGYERQLDSHHKLTIRGIYRSLGNGLEDAFVAEVGRFVLGNPGSGPLGDYDEMERDYKALEVTLVRSGAEDYNFLVSYVVSRNEGNYPGLFASEYGVAGPNGGPNFDFPDQMPNSHGLLPNDRPHVLKLSGSWKASTRIELGSSFFWMSGTPLNEFGSSAFDPFYYTFIQERGSAGRTPAIWDLNLRLAYLTPWGMNGQSSRILLDLLHIGSPRTAVNYEQRHYLGQDAEGNPANPNPTYLLETAYQPPFTMRLGVEVEF